MTTTYNDVTKWLENAKTKKATHLIMEHDQWDYENYPILVFSKEECQEKVSKRNSTNMVVVEEVYDMSMDIDLQRAEFRAMHV